MEYVLLAKLHPYYRQSVSELNLTAAGQSQMTFFFVSWSQKCWQHSAWRRACVWLQADESSARKSVEEETVLPDVGIDIKLDQGRHWAVLIFRCEAQKSLEALLSAMGDVEEHETYCLLPSSCPYNGQRGDLGLCSAQSRVSTGGDLYWEQRASSLK